MKHLNDKGQDQNHASEMAQPHSFYLKIKIKNLKLENQNQKLKNPQNFL